MSGEVQFSVVRRRLRSLGSVRGPRATNLIICGLPRGSATRQGAASALRSAPLLEPDGNPSQFGTSSSRPGLGPALDRRQPIRCAGPDDPSLRLVTVAPPRSSVRAREAAPSGEDQSRSRILARFASYSSGVISPRSRRPDSSARAVAGSVPPDEASPRRRAVNRL